MKRTFTSSDLPVISETKDATLSERARMFVSRIKALKSRTNLRIQLLLHNNSGSETFTFMVDNEEFTFTSPKRTANTSKSTCGSQAKQERLPPFRNHPAGAPTTSSRYVLPEDIDVQDIMESLCALTVDDQVDFKTPQSDITLSKRI